MKTFNVCAAQGDLLLRKIDMLPADAIQENPENDGYVLAHSETGHNHIVKAQEGVQFYRHSNDNFKAYLVVNNDKAVVEHMRSFDTHESIECKKGIYEIRRQREYTAEGFRRAAD